MSWLLSPVGAISSISDIGDVAITTAVKGDILAYNGSTWVDVTVGANTEVLTADSTVSAGVKWAAPAAGGEVNDLSASVTWVNVPDANITLSSVTQHVTSNATHTGDVTGATALTIAAKAVDVAMLADGTDGELITWSATGVAAVVAVGTATHVLTSNGVGVAPTFQAAAGGGGSGTTVVKTADETVVSSTTLQDDDHIAFTGLDADTWYYVDGYFEITSTSTPDFKSQFVFTQTPADTGTIHYIGNETAIRNTYNVQTEAAFNGVSTWVWGISQTFAVNMRGSFKTNASTGGNLKLQWAQVVSSASTTRIRAGAWVTITPI